MRGLIVLTPIMAGVVCAATSAAASDIDFTVKTLEGKGVDLAKTYGDKVLLVVNVASKCGLTPHYEGIEASYEKDKGLCVLGFPCNQSGKSWLVSRRAPNRTIRIWSK